MYSFLPRIICVIALIINCTIISYIVYDEYKKNKIRHEDELKEKEYIIKVDELEPIIELDKEPVVESPELVSLGEFKLTAYCPCNICCGEWSNNRPDGVVYGAIGEELKENYSIAVDPKIIPFRTEVVINGHIYKAQDRGGAIKGNRIDVYMEDHQRALEFGVQYAEVFVENK